MAVGRRGRPRRLQLDQIVEAALFVGLHGLTMAAVAAKLGVGKAVLYSYVASREELVQIAAASASRQQRDPVDDGQHWAVWIIQYARALFETLTMDGELLESFISGGQAPAIEVDATELWLNVLTRRGFTGEEVIHLRRAVSYVVIGAAASLKHEQALALRGQAREQSAREAVLARLPEHTPLLRQNLDDFALAMTASDWESAVYELLKGVCADPDQLKKRGKDPSVHLDWAGLGKWPPQN